MLPASPDNEGPRLLAEYRAATRLYSRAVAKLSREQREQRLTVSDGFGFDKLMKLVDQARADFEKARDALSKFRNST